MKKKRSKPLLMAVETVLRCLYNYCMTFIFRMAIFANKNGHPHQRAAVYAPVMDLTAYFTFMGKVNVLVPSAAEL